MRPKVAIADHQEIVITGLKEILAEGGIEVIATAYNSRDLLKGISRRLPDVAIVGVHLPSFDGACPVSRIRARFPDVRIIALGAKSDLMPIRKLSHAGAHSYVFTSVGKDHLIELINAVHTNGHSGGLKHTNGDDQEVYAIDDDQDAIRVLSLTNREVRYLRLLCEEMTNKEIAQSMHVSPRTTEGWNKTLCEKLGVRSRLGLVAFSVRNGIV